MVLAFLLNALQALLTNHAHADFVRREQISSPAAIDNMK
jgi:hypothetical protein